MTEFYDGASDLIADTWGKDQFQLKRKPQLDTTRALAETGIGIHIAGHMHFNDTGRFKSKTGQYLFNIQAPSLAAYVPAYKIVSFEPGQAEVFNIETVIVENVPRFRELFAHYRKEWQYLSKIKNAKTNEAKNKDTRIWNPAILDSKNYREFTEWHLSELTRLRFLPREWPPALQQGLDKMNGLGFARLALAAQYPSLANALSTAGPMNTEQHSQLADINQRLSRYLREENLQDLALTRWNGRILGKDFYKIRNADQLALADIPASRLQHYQFIHRLFQSQRADGPPPAEAKVYQKFSNVFSVFDRFRHGLPSKNFSLNTRTGDIQANAD
jgi:hypothetical protein